MFDCHVHTKISTDSEMEITTALDKAKGLNLGLVITEHMDINYPVKDKFIFNVREYFDSYSKYRGESLLLGVEVGMKEDCVDEARVIVKGNDFDQVIGSIHLVNGFDIYLDDFYMGKSKKDAYEEYLRAILNNLNKFEFIDTLGHIDYICRYSRFEDKEIRYDEFSYIIDLILKKVIESEKAIEINTRRLENKDSVGNLIRIYKRYKELGGKMVTIGSDAHVPESIGKNLVLASEIARELELKMVYFKNRKPEYILL